MKDYTQRNFDKLCAALTMDELANFMDCFPRDVDNHSEYNEYWIKRNKLKPSETLNYYIWFEFAPKGWDYWVDVCDRLQANEAKKVR